MIAAQILDVAVLQKENEELRCTLMRKDQKIIHLEEQLEWLKRQLFGQKSERNISTLNTEQLQFSGFELQKTEELQTRTVPAHERKKSRRNGQEAITLPPDLPVETQVIDLPEEEKVCKETGTALVKIGEEVSQRLAFKPGKYFIRQTVRPKYAHPARPETGVLTAPLPESLLPRAQVDDSLLAEIIAQKFANHMPLYRIAEDMGRSKIGISRKLLSQWVVRAGLLLKPLYEAMLKKVLEGQNIYIDETPVSLQEKEKCKTAYMWVVVGGLDANPACRVYCFEENRRHEHALEILKGYRGTLHSDKYGAYEALAQKKILTWCPCWAHIRRKFYEATSDALFRAWVLRKIKYLFLLERVAWSRSAEERLRIRREKEVPIIDELIAVVKEKLSDNQVLPKSKLREALGYFCGLIPYVKNYTERPFARLDNNTAERAIRPLAIGRKNWLFFGSPDGGEAGAVLLSLVQTCRGLEINPREYLEDIFKRLMGHSANKLYELLPDQWLLDRQNCNRKKQ